MKQEKRVGVLHPLYPLINPPPYSLSLLSSIPARMLPKESVPLKLKMIEYHLRTAHKDTAGGKGRGSREEVM